MATEQEWAAAYRAFLERDHPGAWVREQQTAAPAVYVGSAERLFNAGYDAGAAAERERSRDLLSDAEAALYYGADQIDLAIYDCPHMCDRQRKHLREVEHELRKVHVQLKNAAPPRPEPARREGE